MNQQAQNIVQYFIYLGLKIYDHGEAAQVDQGGYLNWLRDA